MAIRLSKAFGTTPDIWIRMQAVYDIAQAKGREDQINFERYQPFFTDEGYVHIEGLNHPKRVFDLTEGFIRRGFNDDEIRLMLGGNFARVLSELWS